MRTYSECLSCLADQAAATARMSCNDPEIEQRVIRDVGRLLQRLDTALPPPENAEAMYALVAGITGIEDPYRQLRRQSNRLALSLRKKVLEQIRESADPLKTAVHYAVAANVIDYGTRHTFDAMDVLTNCLHYEFLIDDTAALTGLLKNNRNRKILYLADNSGEIVFDGILVRQLQGFGCDVTLAVREKPVLNDVTMRDAEECGIDGICRVISTGSGCPGIPLAHCSDEFRELFEESDIIISKGQGNFETLSETDRPIFFLLTVKCPVVGCQVASMRRQKTDRAVATGEMIVMKRGG